MVAWLLLTWDRGRWRLVQIPLRVSSSVWLSLRLITGPSFLQIRNSTHQYCQRDIKKMFFSSKSFFQNQTKLTFFRNNGTCSYLIVQFRSNWFFDVFSIDTMNYSLGVFSIFGKFFCDSESNKRWSKTCIRTCLSCSISLFRCAIKDVTKQIEKRGQTRKLKIIKNKAIKWVWFFRRTSHVRNWRFFVTMVRVAT